MNKLFFTVGLPGSGKSTWVENNKEKLNAVVHSSDTIREQLGDINDQSKNNLVFEILHKRVKEDLLNSKNVIYDSTGINRKNRLAFLREIKHISCKKICVLLATPYEICLKNNAARERKVPEDVIARMYKSFDTPWYSEGFDDIQIIWYDYKKDGLEFNYKKDLLEWRKISQDNPHHSLSIGDHMMSAYNYYMTDMCDVAGYLYNMDLILSTAILMHDCGKPFTKGFLDSKGNPSKTAHFYNHNNSGSYLCLFYLKEMEFEVDETLHISLLIGLHMRPFLAWNNSERAKERDRRLFGDDIIKQVEIIHQYDVAAH